MEKSEELDLIFERLQDENSVIQKQALDMLLQFVKGTDTATTTASSNLRYLEQRKADLEHTWKSLKGENKRYLSDMISVIYVLTDDKLALHYRVNGNIIPLETWGHQYVKKILGCILQLNALDDDLKKLVEECISFLFTHNLETDAIDFLHELNLSARILNYVDEHNYNRITLYLQDFAKYFNKYETILLEIHNKMKNYTALLASIFKLDKNAIPEFFRNIPDELVKTQISFILARCNYVLPPTEEFLTQLPHGLDFFSITCNAHLQKIFSHLIKDLQIEKPKQIKDFLKGTSVLRGENELSLKSVAPISIANSFVHLGFGRDTIYAPESGDIHTEIDFNYISGTAKNEIISVYCAIGALNLFDQRKAFEMLNEHLFAENPFRKTGALLGLGISNSKIFDPNHTTLALLLENLKTECPFQKIATLLSIQLIYSASHDEKLKDILKSLVYSENVEISCFAAFVIGSIYMGSGDLDLVSILIQCFVDKSFSHSNNNFFLFVLLGLSLLFYKNMNYEPVLQTLKEMNPPHYTHISVLIRCMANIGTGRVDLMNEMLADAFDEDSVVINMGHDGEGSLNMGEPNEEIQFPEKSKNTEEESLQNLLKSITLIGTSLLCMGDDLFTKMGLRIATSTSLMDNVHLKGTIPLCIALLSPSNPTVELVDFLNKQCNTSEIRNIINSIIGLGVIGAGTNNTRISEILEQQYSYNSKFLKVISALNISQGLLHMGKGTFTLSPYCLNKTYLREKNFIGLFTPLFMLIDDDKSPMLSKYLFLNNFYIQASSLRHVTTVDKNLNFTKTQLRIGNPVNNVGVVGRPKKITSIQTHSSPIVVQESEMVEIGEEVTAITEYIEDVVIVNKN